MVTSGLLEERAILKAVWRFVTTMHGALCVMTFGEHLMQMWPVGNLDFDDQVQLLAVVPSLARELVTSSWTMCSVLVLKPDS